MEKLFAMQVAAALTQAACAGLGSVSRSVDPELKDQTQRAINLEVWEVFRAYYAAIDAALADTTSWPAPAIPAGQVVPNVLASGLTNALQTAIPIITQALGTSPLAALLPLVMKALTPATTPVVKAPVTPLPNPGGTTTVPAAA